MPFLSEAAKTLSILLVLFFVIFFYLCVLWTNRDKKKMETIFTGFMVSILNTFKIALIGFFLILIIALILDKPFL